MNLTTVITGVRLIVSPVQSEYVVTPGQVMCYVEKQFVRKLVSAVNREVKLLREKR